MAKRSPVLRLILVACLLTPTIVSGFGVPSRRQFVQGAVVGAGAAAVTVAAPSIASAGTTIYSPDPHSLDGKLMVVTGGTTGLGLETGKRLAAAGASIVLTSRTAAKGKAAVEAVEQYVQEHQNDKMDNKIYSVVLDLDDLDSVKGFPDRLAAAVGPTQKTNVLINNAGVMAIPDRQLTKDGFERTFQSNHLGHFVLTSLMLDRLAPDARIINVSSEAYLFANKGLELDNLNGERKYGPWSSYGQSKLANILFTQELQARAQAANRPLTVYALHPGAVQTDLARNMMGGPDKWEAMKTKGLSGWDAFVAGAVSKFTLTVEEGASTQVYLAAAETLPPSADQARFFANLKPQTVQSYATDSAAARKLWAISEELGQVQFKL